MIKQKESELENNESLVFNITVSGAYPGALVARAPRGCPQGRQKRKGK